MPVPNWRARPSRFPLLRQSHTGGTQLLLRALAGLHQACAETKTHGSREHWGCVAFTEAGGVRTWTDDQHEKAVTLAQCGMSASGIAKVLGNGTTRNMVIGRLWREKNPKIRARRKKRETRRVSFIEAWYAHTPAKTMAKRFRLKHAKGVQWKAARLGLPRRFTRGRNSKPIAFS